MFHSAALARLTDAQLDLVQYNEAQFMSLGFQAPLLSSLSFDFYSSGYVGDHRQTKK